jgi:multisubunit Na+/H+ antiporter MnhC subunit
MTNTWYLYLFFAAALVGAGILGLLGKRNLIKLFIAIEVIGKGISLVLMGTGAAKASLLTAQALVVTYIVIEVSLVATALALVINIQRRNKTLDIRQLTKLKG